MKISKFFEKWVNLNSENNLLKFVIVVLTLGLLGSMAAMIYVRKNERTIVVPAYVDRQFTIDGEKASPEYIEMMSKYSVELISNFTPETIKERINEFMRFIEPAVYKDVSTGLMVMADEVVKYKISQFFIPQQITQQGNSISVTGLLRKYVQDKELVSGAAAYSMKFKINQGRFQILSYEKVEPQQPNQ